MSRFPAGAGPRRLRTRHLLALGFLLANGLLLVACATGPSEVAYRPPAITVTRIVSWSHHGVPSRTIIRRLRRSHSVYRLSGSQLAALRREGVSARVVDYMQRTYLRAVRRDQRLRDESFWAMGPDGYFYGSPAFWGWGGDFDLDEGDEGDEGED